MKRDLLSLVDLGAPGVREILEQSAHFERVRGTSAHARPLAGLTVARLFDLPSTRTRIGPGSLTWDAVAARLHTAKAALVWAARDLLADRASRG